MMLRRLRPASQQLRAFQTRAEHKAYLDAVRRSALARPDDARRADEPAKVAPFLHSVDPMASHLQLWTAPRGAAGTAAASMIEAVYPLSTDEPLRHSVRDVGNGYSPFRLGKFFEAVDALTDVSELITATMKERDPKRKIAWRQHLISAEGRMTMLLRGLEAQQAHVAGPFVAGADLSVADLAVWRAVGWLSSGVIDGIPKTFIKETFPEVWAVHAAVDAMPEVAAWKKKNPHHYKK